MKVSIIIPVKKINDYIREAIPHYLSMDYDDFEILIFPDEPTDETFERTQVIPSGKVGPAEKRDMALQYASGEIFAFIDDDAYPEKDWLSNALKYFKDESVGAVGGPAVTAPNDNIWQQGSGKVYESFLCSGGYTYRYIPGRVRDVDDLPSVNLIVRKDVFAQVGGYDSNYYPGEDTKLCLDIVEKARKRIVYAPDVLVYHHRRTLYRAHLKQITNYAKHRGYFAKALPQTSCRPAYFIPSFFTLGLLFGPLICMCISQLWYFYWAVCIIYVLLCIISIKEVHSLKLWLLTISGIFLTHMGYGLFFIRGLFASRLLR